MTLEAGAAIGACGLSLTGLIFTIRVAFKLGRSAEKLETIGARQAEILKLVGNGEPGVLVRREEFRPVESEVQRSRQRIHEHAQIIQKHEFRIANLEQE